MSGSLDPGILWISNAKKSANASVKRASTFLNDSRRTFESVASSSSSSSSSADSVDIIGVTMLGLGDFDAFIAAHPSLHNAGLVSCSCYRTKPRINVAHRFLIIHIRTEKQQDVWLRLDRRPSSDVRGIAFASASGDTSANDRAMLSLDLKSLIFSFEMQENELLFDKTLFPLQDLNKILKVIFTTLDRYKLGSANCWAFCSVLQEILYDHDGAWFRSGDFPPGKLSELDRSRVFDLVDELKLVSDSPVLVPVGMQTCTFLPESQMTHFRGLKPRLVVSVDIGSSSSVVAVALLEPKKKPLVYLIDRWPGQEHVPNEIRVPAVLKYKRGRWEAPVAVGAEAVSPFVEDNASGDYEYVRNFKPLLNPPPTGQNKGRTSPILQDHNDPLPRGPTLKRICSDYVKYLTGHTRYRLLQTFGYDVLEKFRDVTEIVLIRPSVWPRHRMGLLRLGALDAGLVTESRAEASLHLRDESEASIRFLMERNMKKFAEMKVGTQFMVVDAGASSTNLAVYTLQCYWDNAVCPELLSQRSVDAGGMHVDLAFKQQLEQILQDHRLDNQHRQSIVSAAVDDFTSGAKTSFNGEEGDYSVKVDRLIRDSIDGSLEDGRLRLDFASMESFFAPTVTKILNEALRTKMHKVELIFLTGGFSNSKYLQKSFEKRFMNSSWEIQKIIPVDETCCKGASLGALVLMCGELNRTKRGLLAFF